MFKWFESLVQPYPSIPSQPPTSLYAFCVHYTRVWPVIFAVSCLAASVAIFEVMLFGYMGQLVDWFATRDPQTFVQEESASLWRMGLVILLLLPVCHPIDVDSSIPAG